jgi:hypothetical protein
VALSGVEARRLLHSASATDCPFGACHARPVAAQNDASAGIVFEDGGRFRVVDTWLSLDRHGPFDVGYYVFLKRVDNTPEDRLAQLAPDYFRD